MAKSPKKDIESTLENTASIAVGMTEQVPESGAQSQDGVTADSAVSEKITLAVPKSRKKAHLKTLGKIAELPQEVMRITEREVISSAESLPDADAPAMIAPTECDNSAEQDLPSASPGKHLPTRRKKSAAQLSTGVQITENADTSSESKPAARSKRQKRVQPATKGESVEQTPESQQVTSAVMRVPSAPAKLPESSAAAAEPSAVTGLKPLFALGIEDGILVLAVAQADDESVESFARYESEPLPRMVSAAGSYLNAHRTESGPTVYTAYIPWPGVAAGPSQIGYSTVSGKNMTVMVNCLPYRTLKPAVLLTLIKRFGRMLLPALDAVLVAEHPLRKALLKPIQAVPKKNLPSTLQGNFDGIIDGLAHGWAYDPQQPDRHFTIEILCDGEVVARGPADRYRDDLQANGIGDGSYHFRLRVSYELFDGKVHKLTARAVGILTNLSSHTVNAVFPDTQPKHFDWMPRQETIKFARQLANETGVENKKAVQVLLKEFEKACLQQETWLLGEARSTYQKITEILGVNALCCIKIAETWMLENKLDQANKEYLKAESINSKSMWPKLGIGNIFEINKLPIEAENYYYAALNCSTDGQVAKNRVICVRYDALVARATQYECVGNKRDAVEILKKVVLYQPNNNVACALLDKLLRDQIMPNTYISGLCQPDYVENANKARRLIESVIDEAEKIMTNEGVNE